MAQGEDIIVPVEIAIIVRRPCLLNGTFRGADFERRIVWTRGHGKDFSTAIKSTILDPEKSCVATSWGVGTGSTDVSGLFIVAILLFGHNGQVKLIVVRTTLTWAWTSTERHGRCNG
jgi:hypothetical protein